MPYTLRVPVMFCGEADAVDPGRSEGNYDLMINKQ